MATILVVYATDYGNTEKMANAVGAGIVFGSPVHMDSVLLAGRTPFDDL